MRGAIIGVVILVQAVLFAGASVAPAQARDAEQYCARRVQHGMAPRDMRRCIWSQHKRAVRRAYWRQRRQAG